MWGISSAGRAPGSQSGGQGFDPPMLHHEESIQTHTSIEAASPSKYGLTRPKRETTTIQSGRFFVVIVIVSMITY